MKPAEAITLYTRMTQSLNGRFGVYPVRHVRKTLKQASELLDWCEREDIDLKRFIEARHDAVKWKRRIPLSRLKKVSDRFLGQFREWMEAQVIDREANDRFSNRVESDTDRRSELTVLGEATKASYAENPDVCLAVSSISDSLTGGWNPKSEWCQRCPRSGDCRQSLADGVRECREHLSLA